MASAKPWSEKWQVESDLTPGGQGKTFLVVPKDAASGFPKAVLKILKNRKSAKARRRMLREVTNLRTLHNANCRVPEVLDTNVERYDDPPFPLYFVMEYVPGKTLTEYVSRNAGIPFEEACSIVLSLCKTIAIAQGEDIFHRDLKPENIILRDKTAEDTAKKRPDVVIVDYGLSFDRSEEEDLTAVNEPLDNTFMSLPERRVPGGDRRDPRSDLTGVCGILYFCLTGHRPVDLLGADNNPPHRRPGHSVREKLGDTPLVRQLEVFFDRGFSMNIDHRFQTVDELTSRLKEVLNPAARAPTENPIAFAKRSTELFLARDRKTQLAEYRKSASEFHGKMGTHVESYRGKLGAFHLAHTPFRAEQTDIPDYDDLGISFAKEIRQESNPERLFIVYQIRSRGTECAVFRVLMKPKSPHLAKMLKIGEWKPILRYDGLSAPNMKIVLQDFDALLTDAMEIIQRDILERQVEN